MASFALLVYLPLHDFLELGAEELHLVLEGVFGDPHGELPYLFAVLSAVEDIGEISCSEAYDGGPLSEGVFGSAVLEHRLLPFLLHPLGDMLINPCAERACLLFRDMVTDRATLS